MHIMSGRHKEKQKKSSFDAHKILVNKEMSDIDIMQTLNITKKN